MQMDLRKLKPEERGCENADFECPSCYAKYVNEDNDVTFYYNQTIQFECDCEATMEVRKLVSVVYIVKQVIEDD
jgi:hypothetical protein